MMWITLLGCVWLPGEQKWTGITMDDMDRVIPALCLVV